MILPVLAVVGTLSTQPAQPDRSCDRASTTPQVDACLSRRLSAVRLKLGQYVSLARTQAGKLAEDAQPGSGQAKAQADFDRAETALADLR